jgi:hypothetical protein
MGPLNPVEAAALGGLSGVLWRGVNQTDLSWMRQLPELDHALDQLGGPDDWAAEHECVMVREVHACASVFRSDPALMGGEWAGRARMAFEHQGFTAPDPPDQLGALLGLYAGLCTRDEAAALDLWAEQLRPWASVALAAIRAEGGPLYPLLVDGVEAVLGTRLSGVTLGTDEDPLDDPKTSLRNIADYWLTPARCGWYLSRATIQRMARSSGLPCGFGPRRLMLQNWMQTAIEHDALDRLNTTMKGQVGSGYRPLSA